MAYDDMTAQLVRENEQMKKRLLDIRDVVVCWLKPDGIGSDTAMVEMSRLVDPLPAGVRVPDVADGWAIDREGDTIRLIAPSGAEVVVAEHDGTMQGRMLFRLARDIAAARGVQASGCCRSHPHENMNAECERLTVTAREQNAAASGVTPSDGGKNG